MLPLRPEPGPIGFAVESLRFSFLRRLCFCQLFTQGLIHLLAQSRYAMLCCLLRIGKIEARDSTEKHVDGPQSLFFSLILSNSRAKNENTGTRLR